MPDASHLGHKTEYKIVPLMNHSAGEAEVQVFIIIVRVLICSFYILYKCIVILDRK